MIKQIFCSGPSSYGLSGAFGDGPTQKKYLTNSGVSLLSLEAYAKQEQVRFEAKAGKIRELPKDSDEYNQLFTDLVKDLQESTVKITSYLLELYGLDKKGQDIKGEEIPNT